MTPYWVMLTHEVVEVAHRREAIRFHIDGLEQEGLPIPGPSAICEYVEASVMA